ncbi:MAG: hypothetical protein K6357_07745 [Elusimicrobiota bacterium]
MHIIIGKETGNKAKNLLKLDSLSLTPDFLIIGSDFISKSFGVTSKDSFDLIIEKIKHSKIPSSVMKDIIKNLIKLNIFYDRFIIRSSVEIEDSKNKSYAGLFKSIISDRKNIFNDIRKVLLSQYKKDLIPYTLGIQPMSIIIQKFIKPIVSGVIFMEDIEKPSFYIEYSDGGRHDAIEQGRIKKPYTIAVKKDLIIENTDEFYFLYLFFSQIFNKLKNCGKTFNKTDIEFLIDINLKFKLVQYRSLPPNFSIDFLPLNVNLKTLYSPYNATNNFKIVKFINKELLSLGLKTSFISKNSEVFILKNIYNLNKEILRKIKEGKGIIENVKKNIRKYFKVNNIEKKDIEPINTKFAFYDCVMDLLNRIRQPFEATTTLAIGKIRGEKKFETKIYSTLFKYLGNKNHRLYNSFSLEISQLIKEYEDLKKKMISSLRKKNLKTYMRGKNLSKNFLKGITIYPGKVKGKIFLINDTDIENDIKGEIICAKNLGKNIKLLLKAKGLILENGVFTSHALIIARELKIPTIVAVEGCMDFFKNGEKVIIDVDKIYKI